MKTFIFNILFFVGFMSLITISLPSCSDELDDENYYTFTGQMMSQYLQNNKDLSQFAAIVERAGLMDQLSVYGKYTCFAPSNKAIDNYLESIGAHSLDDLSDAECDTLARTHLVNSIYSTFDMWRFDNGILSTLNMMRRNISVSHGTDENGNTVIVLNKDAQIYFVHQDDSVENGIVQRINAVIPNSVKSIANHIKNDEKASLFYEALKRTGFEMLLDTMLLDKSYSPDNYREYYSYDTGAEGAEWAIVPKTKNYGFTLFVVPDETLRKKYNVTDIEGLYDLACSIYDVMYPQDVSSEGHSIDHLDDPVNPLYRFMAYHILDRNVQGLNYLTVREDLGVDPDYANTTDWYTTMLPGTMIKAEHLINLKWVGPADIMNGYYINRRYDGENYYEQGVSVSNPDETIDAINGIYFYVSDILKFDKTTQDVIDNCRIRMDFSTLFPEIATNNLRMNGKWNDYSRKNLTDDDIGYNYNFPNGYLKGVVIAGTDAKFVYRRPRLNFYSMHGDEMVANGVFDITFNLPPFPFEGEWQLRLGFAPMTTAPRGAVQIYFDGKVTGIPLNMDLLINSAEIYGSSSFPSYSSIRDDDEARQTDFKILKNKGYYRGPYSVFHATDNDPSIGEKFAQQSSTVRKVLCNVTVTKDDLNKVHTLRIKNVSQKNASNKEAMLDYIELVPKSVYGVGGEDGQSEDDL